MAHFHKGQGMSGEITVFFALVSAIIIALLLLIVESARTEGARLYMTIAADSSIDSLFSQYHRKLWEKYRILGLEHYAYDQISDEMEGFMAPYMKADNWYPMKTESIDISDMRLLTDDGAAYYEEEVLDYMKYGIAADVWNYLEAGTFSDGINEGTSVDKLSDLYGSHSMEAVKLEESIEDIGECLNQLSGHYDNAGSALSANDGNGFISEAGEMQRQLERIPGLVSRYIRLAEKMKSGLNESRSRLNAEKENGSISPDTWESLNSDFSEYESYVSEDGERRLEITGFSGRAESGREYLDGLITEAEGIQNYIDSWEPSDEDDELDIEALWRPVRSGLASFDLITLNAQYGIEDKEKEQQLESIQTLLNSDFLKLVLPEGTKLSTDKYDMGDKPSETCYSGTSESEKDIADRVFLAEYISDFMDYFGRGTFDKGSKKSGSGSLENEYILFGNDNDCDNLSDTVKRLIEIRTGLNLVYLYKDTARKNEARTLALAITGAAGLTPLVTVMTFFILSVWSLGQAVCDVRDLLKGEKVPFMHDSTSFYLTLTGLMQSASGSISGSERSAGAEKGLKYAEYLKILLFFGQDTEQDYRSMDVMQMCLMKEQKDFRMDRMIYSLEADIHMTAAHLFSALGIVKANGIDTGGSYQMEVSTAYSY